MVCPSPVSHGFFLQESPEGGGLSCVEQLARRPRHGIDHLPRKSRDARQPLQQVQGCPLGSQEGTKRTGYAKDDGICGNEIPVRKARFYSDRFIHNSKDTGERPGP